MTLSQQLHHSKTHRPGMDPSCPICKRENELNEQLVACGATAINESAGPNGSTLTWYTLRGYGPVIVQRFACHDGYEVYAPLVRDSNSTAETFAAMRKYAGLE